MDGEGPRPARSSPGSLPRVGTAGNVRPCAEWVSVAGYSPWSGPRCSSRCPRLARWRKRATRQRPRRHHGLTSRIDRDRAAARCTRQTVRCAKLPRHTALPCRRPLPTGRGSSPRLSCIATRTGGVTASRGDRSRSRGHRRTSPDRLPPGSRGAGACDPRRRRIARRLTRTSQELTHPCGLQVRASRRSFSHTQHPDHRRNSLYSRPPRSLGSRR